nr:sporulation integral membrane protein YlbJ [Clostridium grantii]
MGVKLNLNIVITFISTLMILSIIINPKICLTSGLQGLNLFIKSVFPSLFPFLVIINLMISFKGVDIYASILGGVLCKPLRLPRNCSIVVMVSFLCGYPLGAKFAVDLYTKKEIDYSTCQRLIAIASNPSPLFVIGFIGVNLLGNPFLGYVLLLSTYISCLIMSFILKPNKEKSFYQSFKQNKKLVNENSSPNTHKIGAALKDAIHNGIITCLDIGGFIVFFSVIISIIKNNTLLDIVLNKISYVIPLNVDFIESSLLGIIEITNGCNELNSLSINPQWKIILISFLLGFSGLSIIAQVSSFIAPYNFSIKIYIKNKLLQGFLCSIISLILLKVDIFNLSENVFNYTSKNPHSFYGIYVVIILAFFSLFIIKKLFNRIS